MKSIFIQNKPFILLHALFFLVALFIIFFTDKLSLHLFFNDFVGNWYCNGFFKYATYLGDGAFVLFLVGLLLLYNMQTSITTLLCYLASAGFTQGIKYSFFNDIDRPILVFDQKHIVLNVVQNVDLNIHHSFPSGHATAAFSMFFCLSLFSTNKIIKSICFAAALLVAFSRVYLSQHFFEDITAGSFIGTAFSFLVCYLLFQTKIAKNFAKLKKPIWQLF